MPHDRAADQPPREAAQKVSLEPVGVDDVDVVIWLVLVELVVDVVVLVVSRVVEVVEEAAP